MSAAKLIFAKAICQPEGDPLIVTCKDYSEAERIRIGLYRERNKLMESNPALAARLVISRKQNKAGDWVVIVGAQEPAFTIQTASGEDIDLFEGVCSVAELDEIERRLRLMKEDGYSDEQLEEERKTMLAELKGGDSSTD